MRCVVVSVLSVFSLVTVAHAAPAIHARQTRLDSPPPIVRYALSAELGNALVGEYAFSGSWAAERHFGVRALVGYRTESAAFLSMTQLQWGVRLPQSGMLADIVLAWHPEGQGISGISTAFTIGAFGAEDGVWLVRVGAWISHISRFGDTTIELGIGALAHYEPRFHELSVAPQLRCGLGISFLE